MSKKFIFFDTVLKRGRVGIDPKYVEAIEETDDGVIIGLNSGMSAVVKGSMKSVADTLEGIYDGEWDYSDLHAERKGND